MPPSLISLTPKRLERLSSYFSERISRAKDERIPRLEAFKVFMKRYEAKTRPKNFPFKNASNIHPPMIAISMDSIKARIMNSIKAQDRLYTAIPLNETPIPNLTKNGEAITWRHVTDILQRVLDYEISPAGEVDAESAIDAGLDDELEFGTTCFKPVWESLSENYVNPATGELTTHLVRSNFKPLVIPIDEVLFPPYYPTIERMPWIAHSYLARTSELYLRARSEQGWINGALKQFLAGEPYTPITPLDEAQDQIESLWSSYSFIRDEYRLLECWTRFDLDGNGREFRLVVTLDWESPSRILQVTPWPEPYEAPPFLFARYIRRRGRLLGMGVPERGESLDDGIEAVVNQMIDSGTVSNTPVWSVRRESKDIQQLDQIWPGKKVFRDDKDDILPLKHGEPGPSLYENFNILNSLLEKALKVTDYNLGRESQVLGRQATATATLALLQETGQYHDNTTRDFRLTLNDVGQLWLDLLAYHKPFDRISQIVGRDDAQLLIAALTLSPQDLRKRVAIRISFSSPASTRELARQEEAAKMQIMRLYYVTLVQLIQAYLSSPLPLQIAIEQILNDLELRMKKLLDSYGETSTSATLPSWQKVKLTLAQQGTQPGNGASGPSIPSLGGLPQSASLPPGPSGMGAPPNGPLEAFISGAGASPQASPFGTPGGGGGSSQ